LRENVGNALIFLRNAGKVDLIYSWFADFSFWPLLIGRIFQKKTMVIVGGYDVAKVAEIKYGSLMTRRGRWKASYSLRKASSVLAVDEGLVSDIKNNLGFMSDKIRTVHTGYDGDKFYPLGEKQDIVLTVANAADWQRVRVKGLDMFVDVAKDLPGIRFQMIGIHGEAKERLEAISPNNLEIYGPMGMDELLKAYQKSKVYCQFSMREGLPNSLCEAMLCECVPVGTNVQGVRTVIDGVGFLVNPGNIRGASEFILKALSEPSLGKDSRLRIINEFTIKTREDRIIEAIQKLIEKS